MARRKRRTFPWFPVVALSLLAAGAYVAWRTQSRWLPLFTQSSDARVQTVAAYLDVCAKVSPAAVANALGTARVDARPVGAGPDVPAAGACTYEFDSAGGKARVVVLVFTAGSLARASVKSVPRAYYASAVTGLEYLFKATPIAVADLGDAAVAAGFADDAAGETPQLIVRRGEIVVHAMATGVARAGVERYVRALLAALP
jgi:hypothetical protein